jgi:hypothetical protein
MSEAQPTLQVVKTLRTRKPRPHRTTWSQLLFSFFDMSIKGCDLAIRVGELVFVVLLIGIAMRVYHLMGPTAPTP